MLTPDGVLPGVIVVESEFTVPGVFGACGVNTAAMVESYATQSYVSTRTMYSRMRAAGRADANGVTTMGRIDAQLKADGFRTAWLSGSWKPWIIARLKEGAVVAYEPSHGQVLHDEISGAGMDASNLQYHFNMMAGYWPGGFNKKAGKTLPEGFWMGDGDNDATNRAGPDTQIINGRPRMVNGRTLQFYSAANIAASAPYTFLAVYPKVSVNVATAPAGLGGGFAAKYVSMGLTAPVSVPETYWNDHECLAVLTDGTVFYFNSQTGELSVDTSRGPKAPWLLNTMYVLWQQAKNAQAQSAQLSDADKADLKLGQAFRAALKAA